MLGLLSSASSLLGGGGIMGEEPIDTGSAISGATVTTTQTTGAFSVGGTQLPTWLLIAGGVAALIYLTRRR